MNFIEILLFLCKIPLSIKNINLPACVNCVNFLEQVPDNNFGSCKLFGEKNIVTGVIKYKFATICREYEFLCSEKGKFYVEKTVCRRGGVEDAAETLKSQTCREVDKGDEKIL